ncbi:MAG TPA: FAD:protein FMN transferase [Candidatus Krumholzibacteria bacterium]|nr:FAD:protein FMN transferase [Candidatus Krumholzibacteria bacterium]HPD71911.1 FAD:protein FMN transferase [Candidatus Krumholzibacteria bacterium]HRY41156.1 FAD:protein FMN transferase [Candidatus Krumholzibacteria bacterium]
MPLDIERRDDHWRATFTAMASPCEILLDLDDPAHARRCASGAQSEALRVEAKFSRYRDDNVIHAINRAAGRPVVVDDETADLLDFAARCHELSGGRFDVTSGALRRLWRFDGSDRVPSRKQVKQLLPLIGWTKVHWERPVITMPAGMEIDLGGIAKEYAVDRVTGHLAGRVGAATLVNFGGDLRAFGIRRGGAPWDVGVERPGAPDSVALHLQLAEGALATSGDANRFLLRRGTRYPHILNPRTGWPVVRAPRSVTVLGDTCTEAGLLATLAMLYGDRAEAFLEESGARHWVIR